MKAVFVLFCLIVAVHGEACTNADVTTCVNTKSACFANQTLACEHSTCVCALSCLQATDCGSVTCAVATHCIDNACICDAAGGNAGGNHGNHHPGGTGHHPGGR